MKILQILPELNVGGVETGTVDLARQLVKLGHRAVVVSNGGALVDELCACGAVHYRLAVHQKSILAILKAVPRLVEIIKKEGIEIVHARSRVPAWIAYLACRRTNATFITTCHGYYNRHPFSYPIGWGKRVIVLSNAIGRHMIEDFAVERQRTVLIPRSVDLERFKFSDPAAKRKEEFHVGIIGRITPLKGHLDFIKAMARVARVMPQLKVWIVGEAPAAKQSYKEEIELLVRRLGLWHCTEFLGVQRDIPAIMQNLDALVLATTTQEAFGRVIIEAQACGVPVVATKVGGVVDIIQDGDNGLLVPPADPRAISEAVLRIYREPAFASTLAQNAYKKVKEKYNLSLMVERTLRVYQDALHSFKILIVKFSSLGDIILSGPSLRAIRQGLGPDYKISLITSEEGRSVLLGCPYIDELIIADFKNKDKGIRGFLNLGRILRKKNFDVVLDLQNNRRSHLLAFLSLAKQRYGYKNGKFSFFLNHALREDRARIDPLRHQARLLELLGVEMKELNLQLWPQQQDDENVAEFLNSHWLGKQQRLVGINLSASAKWPTKNWPLLHIARLCEELSRRELRVVLTGSEKDIDSARQLTAMLKGAKPINACGKTNLNQLACLIRRCSVYISPDSAPLHVAASQGVPIVALFGPTDALRHLPPVKNCLVLKKALPCSPCYKSRCHSHRCMLEIKPQEALEALLKLIGGAG